MHPRRVIERFEDCRECLWRLTICRTMTAPCTCVSGVRLASLTSVLGLIALLPFASAENWPGWRGPRGDGTSLETNAPLHGMPRPQLGANLNLFRKPEMAGPARAVCEHARLLQLADSVRRQGRCERRPRRRILPGGPVLCGR